MAVLDVARFVFAVVYCLAGYAAFVTFLIIVNYLASVWGLLAGVCNTILVHLHLLKLRNTMQDWYDSAELRCSGRFGLAFFALGAAGLTYHIVREAMLKSPILPVNDSEVIPMVWCLITLKSGLMLMYYASFYQETERESQVLVTGENEEDA